MNFSQKVLTVPLWDILSGAFPCSQVLMNSQLLFYASGPPSDTSVIGVKLVNLHFLKRAVEELG